MSPETPNNLTDRQLVDQILEGDTNAFKTVIKNTEGLVAMIVFKMINNAEDRKDIAQDVYLKAFKNLPDFKFRSKLSTWIGTIAYNTCVNYIKKKKSVLLESHQQTERCQDPLETASDKIIDLWDNETQALVFSKELAGILNKEIDKLSPVYKTLITLFHQEELSYGEIAEITQLPEGTVKNYLFRARQLLKSNLLENYKKEDL